MQETSYVNPHQTSTRQRQIGAPSKPYQIPWAAVSCLVYCFGASPDCLQDTATLYTPSFSALSGLSQWLYSPKLTKRWRIRPQVFLPVGEAASPCACCYLMPSTGFL